MRLAFGMAMLTVSGIIIGGILVRAAEAGFERALRNVLAYEE